MYFQLLFIILMAKHRIVFYGWISLALGIALIFFSSTCYLHSFITFMGLKTKVRS